MADYRLSEVDPEDPAAQACLAAYYAELDRRFPGGFVVEASHDPNRSQLVRPHGTFLVAWHSEEPVGCVALKGTCPDYSEIKRMWVAEAVRGSGLASAMMQRIEAVARELGVSVLRLDTHTALPNAIAMYRHWGWTEIAPFNADPYAQVFFEKRL